MKQCEVGDIVRCAGVDVTIAKIFGQELDNGCIRVEFEDTNGNYRRWDQKIHGGELVKTGK